jgi:uncharacterized damage-inducible protein DinB
MQQFFLELFEYTNHYNEQFVDKLISLGPRIPEKCRVLQSHVLNAHQIWNHRIFPDANVPGVWDLRPIEEWRLITSANYARSLDILTTKAIEDKIAYRNSRGDAFTSTVKDILFQVINHSTYHRGQIAMLLRQHDIDPIASDYIHYKR